MSRRDAERAQPEPVLQQGSGLGLVRARNEQVVFETILREGAVSRARIARLTGLSKPTVSSVVQSLEACGLVQEYGRRTGAAGLPPTLYEINPRAGYVLGIDLGGTKVRAGIADLYGEVVVEELDSTARGSGKAVVRQIARLYRRLLRRARLDDGLVRAAAIGVPGIFDQASDRVSAAPNVPGLMELPVSETLTEMLDVPILIENDVNLAAIGERWRGLARADHVVVISIGTGIGMGILIDGEVYRGSRGAAGEIDFLPIGGDPFASDRSHGPLEAAVAAPALVERLRERTSSGESASICVDEGPAGILAAADRGDRDALELLDEEARTVALTIAAVAAVLDPELVVLGGGVGSNPGLLDPVRRYVSQIFPRPVDIRTTALGDRATFYGAVAIALRAARQELLAEAASHR